MQTPDRMMLRGKEDGVDESFNVKRTLNICRIFNQCIYVINNFPSWQRCIWFSLFCSVPNLHTNICWELVIAIRSPCTYICISAFKGRQTDDAITRWGCAEWEMSYNCIMDIPLLTWNGCLYWYIYPFELLIKCILFAFIIFRLNGTLLNVTCNKSSIFMFIQFIV